MNFAVQSDMFSPANELIDFVKNELSSVRKMKVQLTPDEAERLLKKYPVDAVKAQLVKMDNWLPLLQKNKSVYLTVIKWFDIDIQKGVYKAPLLDSIPYTAPVEKKSTAPIFEKFKQDDKVFFDNKIWTVLSNGDLYYSAGAGKNCLLLKADKVANYLDSIKKVNSNPV